MAWGYDKSGIGFMQYITYLMGYTWGHPWGSPQRFLQRLQAAKLSPRFSGSFPNMVAYHPRNSGSSMF